MRRISHDWGQERELYTVAGKMSRKPQNQDRRNWQRSGKHADWAREKVMRQLGGNHDAKISM